MVTELDCENCDNTFPSRITVDGERKRLDGRKYCLECSPYKEWNRNKLHKFDPDPQTLSYIKGVVDSDGSIFKSSAGAHTLSLGVRDKEYAQKFAEKLSKITDTDVKVNEFEEENGKIRFHVQKASKQLYEKLNKLETEDLKPKSYLRPYFDGDGSIYETGKNNYQLRLHSKNKDELKKIRSMLKELDIHSTALRSATQKDLDNSFTDLEEYHYLDFSKNDEIRKFKEKIGFEIKRKSEVIKDL